MGIKSVASILYIGANADIAAGNAGRPGRVETGGILVYNLVITVTKKISEISWSSWHQI